MLFFAELQTAVLDHLRARVRNGQVTERGLARVLGVSQPHIHNVLKGKRALSAELSDQILQQLRLSLLDLVDRNRVRRFFENDRVDSLEYSLLPILSGRLGPGHPWPVSVEAYERFPLPAGLSARMSHPVVARVADDVRMHGLFSDGDFALLDQSCAARTTLDPRGLYLIKRGRIGLVRRLRYLGKALYMVADDILDRPAAWEGLPVEEHAMTYFVRAKVTLIGRSQEWD